jgi:hypothetical protein
MMEAFFSEINPVVVVGRLVKRGIGNGRIPL